MSKILVFLAEGCEEIEALTVVDILRRAKLDVSTVSITEDRQVISSHKIPILADEIISNVDFDSADMIVLPGGIPGTPNLEACDKLMAEVDSFYKQGKRISAICAAPSILAHRGMLKGKRACCNPSFESHLNEGGATVVKDRVVIDGNLIMSRAMGTALDFALAIMSVYTGQEAADDKARDILKAGFDK